MKTIVERTPLLRQGTAEEIAAVLKILIGNAVTYSSGGTILVSIGERTINGNAYQVFTIKDSGIGIPKEESEKIFEKFYRSGPAKLKAPDGTGLGMFIVKNFIEAHRGLVKLESEGEAEISSLHVGELVMDALTSLDVVGYIRYASVYKDFRNPGDFDEFLQQVKSVKSGDKPKKKKAAAKEEKAEVKQVGRAK